MLNVELHVQALNTKLNTYYERIISVNEDVQLANDKIMNSPPSECSVMYLYFTDVKNI